MVNNFSFTFVDLLFRWKCRLQLLLWPCTSHVKLFPLFIVSPNGCYLNERHKTCQLNDTPFYCSTPVSHMLGFFNYWSLTGINRNKTRLSNTCLFCYIYERRYSLLVIHKTEILISDVLNINITLEKLWKHDSW